MIDLDSASPEMWREISEDATRHCYTCGSCVSGCPASYADPPLLIRRLIRLATLGLEDNLLDDDTPWTCVTCSRCEEVCPMDVRPFELCLAIRRWQCRNDPTRIPPGAAEIFKRGYTQPVEKAKDLRRKVQMDTDLLVITDRPALLEKFQEMLMAVQIIDDNDYMFKE